MAPSRLSNGRNRGAALAAFAGVPPDGKRKRTRPLPRSLSPHLGVVGYTKRVEAPRAHSEPAAQEWSRYDDGSRRKAVRRGKEKGVWVFVPAAELRATGHDPAGPVPFYRVWGRARGSVLVRFYRWR